MANARASASGTITFGLLRIPFRLYTAASSEQASFNQLHRTCKGRLKQLLVCEAEGVTVPRDELVKGFEHARDQFVTFTPEELERLESSQSRELELAEFVPEKTIAIRDVEKAHFLGPDLGGELSYALLTATLKKTGRAGIGKYYARGRDQLVAVCPWREPDGGRDGLILYGLYYASELRTFADIDLGKPRELGEKELRLAEQLVRKYSSPRFDPIGYSDEYRARVAEAIALKADGKEIEIYPDTPKAKSVDLREALERSVEMKGLRKGRRRPRRRRRARADLTRYPAPSLERGARARGSRGPCTGYGLLRPNDVQSPPPGDRARGLPTRSRAPRPPRAARSSPRGPARARRGSTPAYSRAPHASAAGALFPVGGTGVGHGRTSQRHPSTRTAIASCTVHPVVQT